MNLGIFTTDNDLVVRSWDDWLERVTGIASADACGKPLASLIPDLEARKLDAFFQRSLREGVIEVLSQRFHHYLIQCAPVEPSRRFRWMQQKVTIAPLKEDAGTIGLIVTVEDVTRRFDEQQDAALVDVFEHEDWSIRRQATDEMVDRGSHAAVTNLLHVLRSQHRNLSVVNSALRVLTGSGIDTAEPLVSLLSDPDHELRMYGALALGDLKDRRAVPALIALLDDADVNVRFHAIEALAKIGAPEAADRLLQLAQSGDFFLSFPAIDALAKIHDPQIIVRLIPLLKDELVRTAVVDALAELGDETVVAPLTAILDRPGLHVAPVAKALTAVHERYEQQFGEGKHIAELVRRTAPPEAAHSVIEALRETDTGRLRALIRLLGWLDDPNAASALTELLASDMVRKEVIESLVRHGRGVTDALCQQLEHGNPEVRRAAVVALGKIGDPASVPSLLRVLTADAELSVPAASAIATIGDRRAYGDLLELLGHPNGAVRQAAIAAVNSLGHPDTEKDVTRMLGDPNPDVRESAVRIAGYFGYHACAPLLMERVHDSEESVRRAAVESLPYFDIPESVPVLVHALEQESPRVRAAAAQALSYVGQRESALPLIAALDDADAWVRYNAARSLGRLSSPEALDRLATVAKSDPATHVRIAAAQALASIGGPSAVSVLCGLLSSPEPDLASAAVYALGSIEHPDALAPLVDMLRSPERNRRLDAVRAFEGRKDREAIEALQWTAARETDPEVASAAITRLASIASAESIGALVRLSAQASVRAVCIAALSHLDAGKAALVAAGLKHPQVQVRYAVIEALSRMKHPQASELLANALDDEQSAVRLAAATALGQLGSHSAERKLAILAANDPDPAVRRAAQNALGK